MRAESIAVQKCEAIDRAYYTILTVATERAAHPIYGGCITDGEALANARLIAAAPELLLACQQAEHWLAAELEHPGDAKPDEILRVLRAAIAKAGE